jgi:hypothetical protein
MCGRARLSSDVSEIKLVFSIPAREADTKFSAKLERGADRLTARRPLRRQGHAAQPRHAALGPDPLLGQGHQGRLRQHQCQGRGDREQARIPQSVRAPALLGAGRQLL